MQTSASASGLALGKDLGKPRSLVHRSWDKNAWQSRSSPALAAAFSLRDYAVDKKRTEVVVRPSDCIGKEIPIAEIDLMGGNGKWRQVKAQEEFKRRRLEEEECKRQELVKEQHKKQRAAAAAERKRIHQQEEERRWQEEREQKRLAQEAREREKREKEEEKRAKREAELEERRRRMPKTCEVCDGSGKCQECEGKGYTFCVFLVHKVHDESTRMVSTALSNSMEHGRKFQGCKNCDGYSHNMLGALKKGSGECPACQGNGKIWPVIDEMAVSPKSRTVQAYQVDRDLQAKI